MSDLGMRPYTVLEIDRMRKALRKRHPFDECLMGQTLGMYETRRHRWTMEIEDKLRTYMTAGVEPSELETAD